MRISKNSLKDLMQLDKHLSTKIKEQLVKEISL